MLKSVILILKACNFFYIHDVRGNDYGKNNIGGIVGYVNGDAEISQCVVSNNIIKGTNNVRNENIGLVLSN